MDFLALAKKINLIIRIGDETPGTEPTAVTGQTGTMYEITQWVIHSHDDICRARQDWTFMRGTVELALTLGTRVLTKSAINTQRADYDVLLPFVTNDNAFVAIRASAVPGAAEEVVQYVPYQQWQGQYDAIPIPTGQPTYFTITSDGGIEFDATPDRDYTVRINYRKKVIQLAANADLPMFPDRYHNAIVWWAIMHYYVPSRDKMSELRQKAEVELKREMTKLYNEQLPDFTVA